MNKSDKNDKSGASGSGKDKYGGSSSSSSDNKSKSTWITRDKYVYKQLEDNGPKWGSNVRKNPDGTFPYDEKMRREHPDKWKAMIAERMAWAYVPRQRDPVNTRAAPANFRQRTSND